MSAEECAKVILCQQQAQQAAETVGDFAKQDILTKEERDWAAARSDKYTKDMAELSAKVTARAEAERV